MNKYTPKEKMKEKPFYKLPIFLYDGRRKWYNPLRYILGADFVGVTADIKKSRVWKLDLDVKDITFKSHEQIHHRAVRAFQEKVCQRGRTDE